LKPCDEAEGEWGHPGYVEAEPDAEFRGFHVPGKNMVISCRRLIARKKKENKLTITVAMM